MEQWAYAPIMKAVIFGYSYLKEHQILCFPLEEVLIAKMRTVLQLFLKVVI